MHFVLHPFHRYHLLWVDEVAWLLQLLKILRYESPTLILYKEMSSSIFQSLSVSPSGMRYTLPDLHFVQYIKA